MSDELNIRPVSQRVADKELADQRRRELANRPAPIMHSLNLYGPGMKDRKRPPLQSLFLADQPSCDVFTAISRDFVMLAGAPLRALHLESRTEMCKASFVNWCLRYGRVNLVTKGGGAEGSEAAGLYWWECQHYPEYRRVITRASLTAKTSMCRPKLGDRVDD